MTQCRHLFCSTDFVWVAEVKLWRPSENQYFRYEVKNVQPYQSVSFTRWWVIFPLLLSLFSFSGYTGWTQIPTERAQQTEIVVTASQKAKRGYHYFSSFSFHRVHYPINSVHSEKLAKLYFNTLTEVKKSRLECQYLLTKPFWVLFLHRTVSYQQDDKPLLLIG